MNMDYTAFTMFKKIGLYIPNPRHFIVVSNILFWNSKYFTINVYVTVKVNEK